MPEIVESIGERFIPGKVTETAPTPPAHKTNGIGEHDQEDVMSLRALMNTKTEDLSKRAVESAQRIESQRLPEKPVEQQYEEALAAQEAAEKAKAEAEAEKTKKKPAAEAATETEKETPPTPKKKAKPQPKPAPTPVLDQQALATLAAETAAATVSKLRQDEPKKPAAGELELSDENQYELEVYKQLEEMSPKMKGVAGRFTESLKKIDAYQRQWEAQNPGQEFDQDAAEHNDFMDRMSNYVGTDDSTFRKAELALVKKQAIAEIQGTAAQPKVAELEQKLRKLEAQPVVARAVENARSGILKSLEIDDLDAADELVKPIAEDAVSRSQVFTEAAINLMNQYVPEKDVHPGLVQQVKHVATTLIAELDETPVEDTANARGQTYLAPHQFYRLAPQQQARHWTVTAADVVAKANELIAEDAKKTVDSEQKKIEALAKKRGWKLETEATTETPAAKTAQTTEPKKTRKPESPSMGGDTKLTVGKPSDAGSKKDPLTDWITRITR